MEMTYDFFLQLFVDLHYNINWYIHKLHLYLYYTLGKQLGTRLHIAEVRYWT